MSKEKIADALNLVNKATGIVKNVTAKDIQAKGGDVAAEEAINSLIVLLEKSKATLQNLLRQYILYTYMISKR